MPNEKPDIYMPLYIGSYLADTMHLSTLEHGAYDLLLLHGWRNEGKIVDDDKLLARITKLPMDQWRAMRPVIQAFFTPTIDAMLGACWTQKRQLHELAAAKESKAKKHNKAVHAAEVRWGKAESDAPSIACAMLEQCPSPSPSEVISPPLPPTNATLRAADADGVVPMPDVDIPQSLVNERFMTVWREWLAHLRLKKKTPTSIAKQRQINRCAAWGIDRAIVAMEHSITNNYQGLFEPKEFKNANGNGKTPITPAAEWASKSERYTPG